MKSIFFDNQEMLILKKVYSGEQLEEIESNKQRLQGIVQKIGLSNENDELDKDSAIMSQMLVETYLKSSTRAMIELHKDNHIIVKGYYFVDDVIVMLDAYRDGGKFTWLPSMKFLNNSIIEMISDIDIDCENEELEGEFFESCNKTDFLHKLVDTVLEGKYRKLLQEENTYVLVLLMNGTSSLNDSKCFIYVVFKDKCAFYFKQENNKFYYGTANRPTIVNILANWMLLQHRDLIIKMQDEEKQDAI